MNPTPQELLPKAHGVLDEVHGERVRQHAKFGEQNPPNGTGWVQDTVNANAARSECDKAFKNGAGTWRHILKEEYHEALAEREPAKLRAELIQVAAVAVSWIEAIDRRYLSPPAGTAVEFEVRNPCTRAALLDNIPDEDAPVISIAGSAHRRVERKWVPVEELRAAGRHRAA